MNEYEQINTLEEFRETRFKEKGSLFIGQAYNISSGQDASNILDKIRKEYYDATHHCYAYKLHSGEFKYSDDGEPNGTAGIRIFNAIEHYNLTDLAVIVIRYFGGVKLGIGPLGKAYYNSADTTLKEAHIKILKPFRKIEIVSGFQNLSHIHRLISNYNLRIENTSYSDKPVFTCLIENNITEKFEKSLNDALNGQVTIKTSDEIIYL